MYDPISGRGKIPPPDYSGKEWYQEWMRECRAADRLIDLEMRINEPRRGKRERRPCMPVKKKRREDTVDMKKKDAAHRAKTMLDAGTDPRDVAEAIGYKSVSGMLGAIRLYERKAVEAAETQASWDAEAAPCTEEEASCPDEDRKAAASAMDTMPILASETTMLAMGGVRVVKRRGEYLVKVVKTTNNLRFALKDTQALRDIMTALEVVRRDMERHLHPDNKIPADGGNRTAGKR